MKDPEDVLLEVATDEIWFDAGRGPILWMLNDFKVLAMGLRGDELAEHVKTVLSVEADKFKNMSRFVDWDQVRRVKETLEARGTSGRVTALWLARFDGFNHLERRMARNKEWE